MTTIARTAGTDSAALLRLALRLDAVASGALGLLGLAAAPLLTDLLGPPTPVLRGIGAFCLVYAAALVLLAARPTIPRPPALAVVAGNTAWVLGSVVAVVAGWGVLTALGVAVALAQAAAVAGFAALQWRGLRRVTA